LCVNGFGFLEQLRVLLAFFPKAFYILIKR